MHCDDVDNSHAHIISNISQVSQNSEQGRQCPSGIVREESKERPNYERVSVANYVAGIMSDKRHTRRVENAP